MSLSEKIGTAWGAGASLEADRRTQDFISAGPRAAWGRAGLGVTAREAMMQGPDSLAVAVRRMRLAAEGFGLSRHAAKEASNTVAAEVVARVYLRDAVDVAEIAESSLRRLQRVDILGSAPRVAADVDVVEVAAAMRRAWNGAR